MKTIKLIMLLLVLALVALVAAAGGQNSAPANTAPPKRDCCAAHKHDGNGQAADSCPMAGASCCKHAQHAKQHANAAQDGDSCPAGGDCCHNGAGCKDGACAKDCACCNVHKAHATNAAADTSPQDSKGCCACCGQSCKTQLSRR